MVSSGAAKAPIAFWGAYAASKAALEHLTFTYAAEVKQTNIHVNVLDPGVVATRMRAQAFPGEDPGELPRPEAITDYFVRLASQAAPHGQRIVVI
jgi:NAD(P)-dependent dehydrogenase (short-subunit alcohol dehydrogenase family)